MLGIELLPRIRNWKDLIFYRPYTTARYQHINPLFGDADRHVIDFFGAIEVDTRASWRSSARPGYRPLRMHDTLF